MSKQSHATASLFLPRHQTGIHSYYKKKQITGPLEETQRCGYQQPAVSFPLRLLAYQHLSLGLYKQCRTVFTRLKLNVRNMYSAGSLGARPQRLFLNSGVLILGSLKDLLHQATYQHIPATLPNPAPGFL